MGWETKGSTLLHKGPFLSLHRDFVVRPDGSAGTYEHVVTRDSVRVAAIDGESKLILVADDFYLQGRRVLHLPGGGVEGDSASEAAAREIEEETGWVPGNLRQLGVLDPLPGITSARVHLFLATDLRTGNMHRDVNEIGMVIYRKPLEEAVQDVRSGGITEAGSVAAILMTAMFIKTEGLA